MRKNHTLSIPDFTGSGHGAPSNLRIALETVYLSVYCAYAFQRRNNNDPIFSEKKRGSLYVSVKLPTYPSPKPTLTLSSYLGQNVGLGGGGGVGGKFHRNVK